MIDEFLQDARDHMAKSVESTRIKFQSIRTGRASPALLDRISVDYYGAVTPLKQLATISAPEARMLTVQPYDKSSIKAIERAIMESDLGLTPNNDGNLIRLVLPELTHRDAIERRLNVMDSTALSLCMDNSLPIHVFNMDDERNIERIVSGDRVGTLVST